MAKERRKKAVTVTDAAESAPAADAVVFVDELVGPPAAAAGAPADAAVAAPEAPAEPPVSDDLKAIVEALIYASPEPLALKALMKVLDSEPREDVERAIAALKKDYAQVRGLQLVEIAGGLQIVTRPDLHEWVRRLFQERKSARLSVQALETLAVIAYRQPVTAVEIAEIRGVNTSGVLATLVERKLIKTAGRKPVVGRPFLYATTKEFLLRFGLNDLSDLPKVDDLADVLGFELPGLLNEGLPTDQYLPLGDPDEPAAQGGPSASDGPASPPGDAQPTEAAAPSDDAEPGDPEDPPSGPKPS
jgi:segregation and condensation protein B